MTMQQVTMSEYLKTRYGSFPHCGSCVCQKCLYWWSGRCPEGECYDDKRAKEEPYTKHSLNVHHGRSGQIGIFLGSRRIGVGVELFTQCHTVNTS